VSVAARGISTIVPPTVLAQDELAELFAAQPGLTRLSRRLVATAFGASGVERRHTVLEELAPRRAGEGPPPVFLDPWTGELLLPGTGARNDAYAAHAGPLYAAAARAAIDATPGIGPADVTHVITVSCTGFYAPGPDFAIARELGLAPGVQRYHLGFMGCYAAIPALRLAKQCCEADPDAVVLVVSVELCSLHVRSTTDPDGIVAASLFADGAAAAIVTARPAAAGERRLELDSFATRITPQGEGDMAWRIGDHGFELTLSNAVPAIIGEHVVGALRPLLNAEGPLRRALAAGASAAAIPRWAIHPGGRSILDRVAAALGLSARQLAPARRVLRDYGNMSSATVLFVLRALLDAPDIADGERCVAMAFGPGLTVESALLTVRT